MTKHKSYRLYREGFTIVELMIGMLAGAVVALTAGIVLVQGFASYSHNTVTSQLQRDGSIAVEMLQRRLREAGRTDVTLVSTNPCRLDIELPSGGNVSFRDSGDRDLVYIAADGSRIIVADNTLHGMTVGLAATWAHVTLAFWKDPKEKANFDAVVHFRN